MLTRSQIQRIAQRHGIGAQAQERDYIQHILLFLLYRKTQELIFKGGTALRIVYHGNRYSEDLDFNAPLPFNSLTALWHKITADLLDFGIQAVVRHEWQSEAGYSFDVSYQGPLFDGRDRTKGKIRIDNNLRMEDVQTIRELVNPEYDDLRPFVAAVLAPEELLAEKVRAFLVRAKPRDIYDIWLLSSQGVNLDENLLKKKLQLVNLQLTPELWQAAVQRAEQDWERDMRALLPQYISWEDVQRSIRTIF